MVMPPNLRPHREGSSLIRDPTPGVTALIPGIPMQHSLDGDPENTITTACVQTLSSMSHYSVGSEVERLALQLRHHTFRCFAADGEDEIAPFYTLTGLKKMIGLQRLFLKICMMAHITWLVLRAREKDKGVLCQLPRQ
jgi:hypothetical protein